MRLALILFHALLVPITVAAVFPPPQNMEPFRGLLFIVWLGAIGALAGYGVWAGSFKGPQP